MVDRTFAQLLSLLVCGLILLRAEGSFIDITYVKNAVSKGAGGK